MKAFKIACAAFILSIASAAFFSVYTCWVVRRMIDLSDCLPDVPGDRDIHVNLVEAEECWERHKLYLSISVSHRELDEIEEALSEVTSSVENMSSGADAEAAYTSAVSNLRERLARLLESERLSLEGVL